MKPFTPSDIAPILACFLALVRFLIPIREVLAVRRGGNLGVSPFPVVDALSPLKSADLYQARAGVRENM